MKYALCWKEANAPKTELFRYVPNALHGLIRDREIQSATIAVILVVKLLFATSPARQGVFREYRTEDHHPAAVVEC